MIDEQIALAESGEDAYIGVKINSLTDKRIIDELIRASKTGVKIELAVRGICCLIPGISGETENIRVVSIVGRFLEHSKDTLIKAKRIKSGFAKNITDTTSQTLPVAQNPPREYAGLNGANLI